MGNLHWERSLSVVFLSVLINNRPLLVLGSRTFIVLATYSAKPCFGYSITRMATCTLGVERWQE